MGRTADVPMVVWFAVWSLVVGGVKLSPEYVLEPLHGGQVGQSDSEYYVIIHVVSFVGMSTYGQGTVSVNHTGEVVPSLLADFCFVFQTEVSSVSSGILSTLTTKPVTMLS